MVTVDLSWSELKLKPDAEHGAPLGRSSHGVSYLSKTQQLFVYGGEHVARTPLEEQSQNGRDKIYGWVADLKDQVWKGLSVNNNSDVIVPPLRIAHAQAVHTASQIVYIFGGRAGIQMQEDAMNDLWAWDPSTQLWIEVTTQGFAPEARSFHRMICVGDCLYVFGGCGQQSGRMADLHCLDLKTKTWSFLTSSPLLKGRGGPNLLPINSGQELAVVSGFAGQETNDGHVYDTISKAWKPTLLAGLDGLRPRSVCASASFPNLGVSVIFGGEVDPSERGHEGAGGFANDVVVLDERTGALIETIAPNESWPGPRGWADASAAISTGPNDGKFYVFGGLAGDDKLPIRLDDLWELTLSNKKT